jgi:transposase
VVWCHRARICQVGQTGVPLVDVPCVGGIDGATAQGDMAWRPSGERGAVPKDAGGVGTRVERLQALHPPLLVLAATGGLARAATAAWATAGLPVVVVKPRPDPQRQELRARFGGRQHLIGMRTAAQPRRAGTSGRLQTDRAAHRTWLTERLAPLDDAIATRRRASPLWRAHAAVLQSAPGLGPVCARTLWLALPA